MWKLAAGSNTPTLLTFPGLKEPEGVAVDIGGDVYVTDLYDNQVWKLPAGSNTPTPLPFTDLQQPSYLAVDSSGNLYVADLRSSRVLKLAAGASRPTVLPFPGLERPGGLAVDADGTVYATSYHDQCTATGPCAFLRKTGRSGDGRVLKLAHGSSTPSVLPFSGLDRLWDVTVDAAGEVYVTDSGGRVLKLPVQR